MRKLYFFLPANKALHVMDFRKLFLILAGLLITSAGMAQYFNNDTYLKSYNTLIPYKIAQLWGYSDVKGNILIQPKYDEADFFSTTYAEVSKKTDSVRYYTLIDSTGKELVPMNYKKVVPFYEYRVKTALCENKFQKPMQQIPNQERDRMVIDHLKNNVFSLFCVLDAKNNKWGLYQSKIKKLVTPCLYKNIEFLTYRNNHFLFLVEKDTRFGVVNEEGQIVRKCIYERINLLESSKKIRDSLEYITPAQLNAEGTEDPSEPPPLLADESSINDSHVIFKAGENKRPAVKEDSLFNLYKKSYDSLAWVDMPSKKYIYAQQNKKWGIIHASTGKTLIPCLYDEIKVNEDFKLDLNALLPVVKLDKKLGVINYKNEILVPIAYELIYRSYDSNSSDINRCMFYTKCGGKWGIYHFKFKEVVPNLYDSVGLCYVLNNTYSEYRCAVMKNGKWGMVDNKNKEIVPFIFNLPVKIVPNSNFNIIITEKSSYVYNNIYFINAPDKGIYNCYNMERTNSIPIYYLGKRNDDFKILKIFDSKDDFYYVNNFGLIYKQ